ncbi:DUF4040 domain-containing protein [Streptomyces sp. TS71-3]|uniref:Na(+)/H(+) antiporter subunit B n=1 Tax=Streptomyces sp. TS71-3 TaxID=2733862 RepID=UPI001B1B9A49|nr:DUF4040 domain-containing protein [Streptomyces sp. TS71-3]GHJ42504.1 hypothetical protein Sm713_81130 [Streptomyces sp. TS71-3]
MNDALVVISLLLVAASGTAAVAVRDPERQAMVLAVLGLTLAVLFTVLQAPDVALSQLAVGSVLTPLLILLSVRKVRRRPGEPRPGPERGSSRGPDSCGDPGRRGTGGRGSGRPGGRSEGAGG